MKPPSLPPPTPLSSETASFGSVCDRRRIRIFTDWFTRFIIKAGGIGIILCILGMCVFLVKEVVPLFQQPQATPSTPILLPLLHEQASSAAIVGIDEHQELAYVVRGESIEFVSLNGTLHPSSQEMSQSLLPDGSVTTVARAFGKGHRLAMGTGSGEVIPIVVEFQQEFKDTGRSISPSVTIGEPIVVDSARRPITRMISSIYKICYVFIYHHIL